MDEMTEFFERFKTNFTTSLRGLCQEKGSANKVCKELGINRQQFAKYLSATNIPSAFMLQRFSLYFGVEPNTFFLPVPGRSTRSAESEFSEITENLEGYYLEHTLVPELGSDVVAIGLWVLERSGNAIICRGELPQIRPDRKRHFESYEGAIVPFGLNFRLSTQCQSLRSGLVHVLAREQFAPSDLLGMRLMSGERGEVPVMAMSLLRFLGSDIDVANVLGIECGIVAENRLSERSRAALHTIRSKFPVPMPAAQLAD